MGVFVLADGMGTRSHPAIGDFPAADGRTASTAAVSYLKVSQPGTPQELYDVVQRANTFILENNNQHPNFSEKQKIATTVTASLLTRVFEKGKKPGYRLYTVAVGDSPEFRVREEYKATDQGRRKRVRKIKQLTFTETDGQGRTNGIGARPQVRIDPKNYSYTEVKPKDIIMLCSDGVYADERQGLSLQTLLRILKGRNPQRMADKITTLAVRRSKREERLNIHSDDASALIIRLRR